MRYIINCWGSQGEHDVFTAPAPQMLFRRSDAPDVIGSLY